MKDLIKIYIVILFLFNCYLLRAQTSRLVTEDIAVFYPAKFDSSGTLPSLAVIRKLSNEGAVPPDWFIIPKFFKKNDTTTVLINFPEDADLYGTGEVTGPLKRNNTEVVLWNTDNYGYSKADGKRLYQSHPWIMGVRKDGTAFGILADNSWKQQIELTNPIKITSEGPAFRIFIIEKDNPAEVLKALAYLTGTMEMPPLWAIGYQQSRYSYFPDTQVMELSDEFRKRKIPCDVIWMDIDYMEGFRIFTFDDKGFPDPEKLNQYLHERDFKSVYMIDPGVKKEQGYWVYDQGSAGNHWVLDSNGKEYNGKVWPGMCAFPDYTRPETRQWWASLYNDFMKLGIDGIWNDMNEPAVFEGPGDTMPEDNIHRGGGDLPADIHRRYHNVYGMLMVKASREGILKASPDKRPFVLSRANFLGGQRYAATWTGDNNSTWDHLKLSIPMSVTLGLSGQPFNGPDIGGFVGDATDKLFGHWIAIGAYYPFSRNHTSSGTVNQEPWAFGPEIEAVSRRAINRRYMLLPYFYTLFREASQTGMPVMRPTFFADIEDLNLRDEEQTFLLGNDLLIVPQWSEDVDLPKGEWREIDLEEEDDDYQASIKIRPGAIVPVGPVIQNTEQYSTDSLTLYVNPDRNGYASGLLYHDEGNGFEFRNGRYELYQFKAKKRKEKSIRLTIDKIEGQMSTKRVYRIGYVKDDGVVFSRWQSGDIINFSLR